VKCRKIHYRIHVPTQTYDDITVLAAGFANKIRFCTYIRHSVYLNIVFLFSAAAFANIAGKILGKSSLRLSDLALTTANTSMYPPLFTARSPWKQQPS
jgi:hypothetical protein